LKKEFHPYLVTDMTPDVSPRSSVGYGLSEVSDIDMSFGGVCCP